MELYALKDGEYLIKLARKAIEHYFEKGEGIKMPENVPKKFREKAGVFITLNTYPKGELRGCIGYPEPIMPLADAAIKAGISAATRDPRFPRVSREEMDSIVIEASILTSPELVEVEAPADYLKNIKIGEHGLIIEKGFFRGLLLPQVAAEEGWNEEEFLSHTCMKAGLTPACWYDDETKVYKFSGKIFSEVKPKGDVMEKKLRGCN